MLDVGHSAFDVVRAEKMIVISVEEVRAHLM